jgi:hypothetical protein
MSFEAVVARVDQIETMLAPATQPPPTSTDSSATSTTDGSFASALSGATQTATPTTSATTATARAALPTGLATNATTPFAGVMGTTATTGAAAAPSGAAGIVQVAESQVGVTEQPPGSNDGPQIAVYRGAVAGSGVGPWCAQFASWVTAKAGEPLGEQGQGFESVSAIYGWAQRTGRANPAGSGTLPKAGDLIIWGSEHVGVIESVDPDGTIHTIEGNAGNAVTRHTYAPGASGATGFVSMS